MLQAIGLTLRDVVVTIDASQSDMTFCAESLVCVCVCAHQINIWRFQPEGFKKCAYTHTRTHIHTQTHTHVHAHTYPPANTQLLINTSSASFHYDLQPSSFLHRWIVRCKQIYSQYSGVDISKYLYDTIRTCGSQIWEDLSELFLFVCFLFLYYYLGS